MLPSVAAALVAGLPDAVLMIDAAGRYQDANPAACRHSDASPVPAAMKST